MVTHGGQFTKIKQNVSSWSLLEVKFIIPGFENPKNTPDENVVILATMPFFSSMLEVLLQRSLGYVINPN